MKQVPENQPETTQPQQAQAEKAESAGPQLRVTRIRIRTSVKSGAHSNFPA